MRKVIITLTALVALAVPATASASDWYWSPERAAGALERYQPSVATDGDGAFCAGVGSSMRGQYGRLYQRFRCNVYRTNGSALGAGTLTVTGKNLWRYRFSYTTRSAPSPRPSYTTPPPGATTIPNYPNGNGYPVQCNDGQWSQSGGIQGACSHHGGVAP